MRQQLACVDRNDDRFGQAGQLSIEQISDMNSQSSSNTQEMEQKGKSAGGKRQKDGLVGNSTVSLSYT